MINSYDCTIIPDRENNVERVFESLFFLLNILLDIIEVSFTIINYDPMIILSFFIIQMISIIGIFLARKDITPNLTFWISYYFFFFFVSSYQYFFNKWEFLNSVINSSQIFYTNILLITFGMFYLLGYFSADQINLKVQRLSQKNNKYEDKFTKNQVNISMFISIIVFLLYFMHINYSSPIGVIYSTFGIAFPAYGLLVLLLSFRKWNHVLRFVYLIGFVIINFYLSNPLISSRWWGLAFLLAIFLIFTGKKLKKNALVLLFLIGFLFFGLIGGITHAYGLNLQQRLILLRNSLPRYNVMNSLTSGQFDAYENFVWTTVMCKEEGLTNGRQLLGNLLFFVPRSWWPEKPVGSGQVIGEYLKINYGMPNTNIANPLPSEGYINFGIIGVLIFGWVFGFLLKKSESWNNHLPLQNAMFFLFIGLVVFIVRGDLMASFAYTFGVLFAGVVLNWVSKHFLLFEK